MSELELLHYPSLAGDTRPPLLLVHGICHSARCWEPFYIPFFRNNGHDVYALSLRSHGASSERELLDNHGLKDYVEDVLSAMARIDRKVVLIGHSMGGAVVQLAMQQAEARIAGAVLLASMVPGSLTPSEKLSLLRKPRSLMALRQLLSGKAMTTEAVRRLPFFDGRIALKQAEQYRGWLQRESRKALGELGGFTTPGGTLPFPLLVIGSRRDYLFGAGALKRTARHYGTQARILDQGCHDLMLDPDWQTSASQIADWLENNVSVLSDGMREPALS